MVALPANSIALKNHSYLQAIQFGHRLRSRQVAYSAKVITGELSYLVIAFVLRYATLSGNSFLNDQGPVVQSIVSLTSSLRGQFVKCFKTL